MRTLKNVTAAVFLLAVLAIPLLAGAGRTTVDIIRGMQANTLVANVNGASETFLLDRYFAPDQSSSVTFTRKDARGNHLDSITFILASIPHVGNVIDTQASDIADYGAGSVTYTDYQKGTPKNFTAGFSCELSGGTSVDSFFNDVTVSVVISPSANASYRLTFDDISEDGLTLGGTLRGVLMDSQNGRQVTIDNGYFTYRAQ